MCGENFKTGGLIAMRYDLRDMTRGNLWTNILEQIDRKEKQSTHDNHDAINREVRDLQ